MIKLDLRLHAVLPITAGWSHGTVFPLLIIMIPLKWAGACCA